MEMGAVLPSAELPSFHALDRSSPRPTMSAILCWKLAGLGALSALCVLKSRSTLHGLSSVFAACSADVTRPKCALDGGLNDESRMYKVFGFVEVGLMVRTIRNLEGEKMMS